MLRRSCAATTDELDPPPPPLRRGRVTIDRARAACTVDDEHAIALTVTELRLLARCSSTAAACCRAAS